MSRWSRRSWLQMAGFGSLAGGSALFFGRRTARQGSYLSTHAMEHDKMVMGPVGRVSTENFNPTTFLRTWNFSNLAPAERSKVYQESPQPDGSTLREYKIYAVDRDIEIAPGLFFPAWTYNGQVPGPTNPRHRRRSPADYLRQPGYPSTHNSLSRVASTEHGRLAGGAPGNAVGAVRLRVRRRTVRFAPLSLSLQTRSSGTCTKGSTALSSSTRGRGPPGLDRFVRQPMSW